MLVAVLPARILVAIVDAIVDAGEATASTAVIVIINPPYLEEYSRVWSQRKDPSRTRNALVRIIVKRYDDISFQTATMQLIPSLIRFEFDDD